MATIIAFPINVFLLSKHSNIKCLKSNVLLLPFKSYIMAISIWRMCNHVILNIIHNLLDGASYLMFFCRIITIVQHWWKCSFIGISMMYSTLLINTPFTVNWKLHKWYDFIVMKKFKYHLFDMLLPWYIRVNVWVCSKFGFSKFYKTSVYLST